MCFSKLESQATNFKAADVLRQNYEDLVKSEARARESEATARNEILRLQSEANERDSELGLVKAQNEETNRILNDVMASQTREMQELQDKYGNAVASNRQLNEALQHLSKSMS